MMTRTNREALRYRLLRLDLIDAIESRDGARMAALLRQGAEPNGPGRDLYPPLCRATELDYREGVVQLLAAGALPALPTARGCCFAVRTAVCHGRVEILRTLLRQGAPPWLPRRDWTPLPGEPLAAPRQGELWERGVETPLRTAALLGYREIVTLLAAADEELADLSRAVLLGVPDFTAACRSAGSAVNAQDCHGEAALHWAALTGQAIVAQTLLRHGAHVDVTDRRGDPPLVLAAHRGDLDLVKCLLCSGARIDAPGMNGRTAFLVACRRGASTGLLLRLLEVGADPLRVDRLGWDALTLAAERSSPAVLRLLLELGVHCAWPAAISSAVAEAAGNADTSNLRVLLDAGFPADPPGTNADWTPLMRASYSGNAEAVRLLLAHGADPHRELENTDPRISAVFLAANMARTEVVRLLLAAGAGRKHAALLTAIAPDAPYGAENLGVATLLLSAGALDEVPEGRRRLPHPAAIPEDDPEMVRLVLGLGAAVDERWVGRTALFQHAFSHHSGCVRALLQAGADPNAANDEGETSLIAALRRCRNDPHRNLSAAAEIVGDLLATGADPDRADANGRSARDWADLLGYPEFIALLVRPTS